MTTKGFGTTMPARELEPTPELARRLLTEQHPDLADLPLTEFSRGWDNTMYRLGDGLTVRLPHRAQAAELLQNEQRWLPVVDVDLPLPIPTPVRVGEPTHYYPWPWSVLAWFEGTAAGVTEQADIDGPVAAAQLGRFLAALHRPAPADAPVNTGRGVPLADRDQMTVDRIEGLAVADSPYDRDDLLRLRERWERYVSLPPWRGPPLWLHADLHAMNVLLHRRRISAIIDFGDITSGDPATDLAIGHTLFRPADQDVFRRAADSASRPIDDAMWERAEGWAMSVGLAIVHSSADSAIMFDLGRRMIGA